jgi:hypothetical protein
MSYGKARDFGPGHKAPKTPVGDTYTRDLLQMLEWNDAYRKSDEFQRFEADRVRRESLAQVATPVVQRQVAQGVIQRQEQEPVAWSEESAAIVLTDESPELAGLLSEYKEAVEATRTVHGVITNVLSMDRNRELRLRQSFGEPNYGRYVSGRKAGGEFGAVWKGLQSSVFDTGQLLRWLYTWAYSIGSGMANFADGMDAGLAELDAIEGDSNEYYRALARPIIDHLRGQDAHYQLGYLMQIDQEMRLGRSIGFVLEIVLTELLGVGFVSAGGKLARLRDLQFIRLGAHTSRAKTVLEVGLPLRIRRSGMTNVEAGRFFGWQRGVPSKRASDFTRVELDRNGWSKEVIADVAAGYRRIAELDPANPSAIHRARQLESLLELFE